MTAYVLTVIGDARSAPLEPAHVERVFRRLTAAGETDWLAQNEACDLFFDSALSAAGITVRARDALSGSAIDTVGTASDAIGLGSRIRRITAAVVRGDMGVSEALRERMALMKGMEHSLLESVYEERISLKAGARTLVQTMRRHGAFCILVSGGFSFFTRRIAERIGFDDHHGNQLEFEDGKLTGAVLEPILGRSAKLSALTKLCDERGLAPCDVLAVGDGANDIEMIEGAGLGVAFHGADSLKKQANACIDHGDLTALLYIQGFRKSEFVLS